MPSDVILEGLYKSQLQDSVQLETVLALYDQLTARNNGKTNYQQLMTPVKFHIDQMTRTRNFRTKLWNEDQSPKVKKERKTFCKKESGRVFSVDGTWTMFPRRLVQFQS